MVYGGTVENVECRYGSLIFYRQIDNSDKVGSIAGVSFPNSSITHFPIVVVVVVIVLRYFLLQLFYKFFSVRKSVLFFYWSEFGFGNYV